MRKLTHLIIATLSLAIIGDTFARRGGSSRSSSSRSSSSSSSSWGSSSKKSTYSKPAPNKTSSWGKSSETKSTSTRTATKAAPAKQNVMHKAPAKKQVVTPKKPISATDKKRIAAAKTSGNYYTDKKSAQAKFKKEHGAKYTSSYKTKPATRPAHIPTTYSSGGRSYNVTYNSTHGGYGYMGPSGTWLAYNMMADQIMYDRYRRQHGYIMESDHYNVTHRPVVTRTVHEQPTSAAGAVMGIVIAVIVVGGIIFLFVFLSKQNN